MNREKTNSAIDLDLDLNDITFEKENGASTTSKGVTSTGCCRPVPTA